MKLQWKQYDIIKIMIKNRQVYQEFEDEIIRKEKVNILKNFSLVEAMYEEAVSLGVFPLKNALEGIEVDIKIAKAVNNVSATS